MASTGETLQAALLGLAAAVLYCTHGGALVALHACKVG